MFFHPIFLPHIFLPFSLSSYFVSFGYYRKITCRFLLLAEKRKRRRKKGNEHIPVGLQFGFRLTESHRAPDAVACCSAAVSQQRFFTTPFFSAGFFCRCFFRFLCLYSGESLSEICVESHRGSCFGVVCRLRPSPEAQFGHDFWCG